MQNPSVIYIQEVEHLVNTNLGVGMQKIQEMISKPDSLNLVPLIFEMCKNPYMIFGAVKIFENHIKDNWPALSSSDKIDFRNFVEKSISTCPDIQGLRQQLNSVLVKIAIRSYPTEWPDFLNTAVNEGQFEQFQYFLEEINTSPIDILPAQKKAEIVNELVSNAPFFLQSLINGYQNSDLALDHYVHYIKWDMVKQVNFNDLFNPDPEAFGPLCSVLQIEDEPEEFIQAAFNILSNLEITDAGLYKRIIPVLKKHLPILEKEPNIQNLTNVHLKLFNIDFLEILYYWEPFVLTIYEEFQKSGGITNRFNLHYQILTKIREYVIYHMIQPPEFIIPDDIPATDDQEQRENYDAMRSILTSFIGMTPAEVNEAFLTGIQYLRGNYNQDNFLSIIWTLGCISGATKSQLESRFVVESMKFILDVFNMPNVEKPIIATSFLFLASAYARAQKLTSRFVDVSITLAIQALDSYKTQKTAANTLLSIARNSLPLINKIPAGLIEIISSPNPGAAITPDTFCKVSEACGRIYQAKNSLDPVLKAIVSRFHNVSSANEINFNVVREQIIVVNGFIGLSRINSDAIEKIVVKNRQILIQITETFGRNVLQIYEENGPDSVNREDLRLMMAYIQSETDLFTELCFKDCGDIFALYGTLPNDLRFSEALSLTEALFKSQLDPNIVTGLHETVIKATEEMIVNEPGEYIDHEELLPKVLFAMAQSYFEIVDPNDLQLLISNLLNNSHVTVLGSIKALDIIVEKADLKLVEDTRDGFFRGFIGIVMYRLLFIITDSGHFYCYSQVLRFLRKLFDFIGTGKIRCQLFPDAENIPGMTMYLSSMTIQDFPLVTIQEMTALIQLMFQPIQMDKFEELIAQYIARTKQTTPGETLNSLRLQQFKNSTSDFIYLDDTNKEGTSKKKKRRNG